MKRLFLFGFILTSSLCMATLHADDAQVARLQEIQKQRELKLENIVKIIQKDVENGRIRYIEEDLYAARIALLTYQRDNAKNREDKINLQNKIVKEAEGALKLAEQRKGGAVINWVDFNKVEDNLLKAQQELIELKLEKK